MSRALKLNRAQILEAVRTLSRAGPVSAPQLAHSLGVHRTTLYKAMESLLEDGDLDFERVGERVRNFRLPPRGIPVLGRVSAGAGTLADGAVQDYLDDLKIALGMDGEFDFFVPVFGDSMSGVGICDGDLAGIRPGGNPQSGQIVLALIEGEDTGVLKTFYHGDECIILASENPAYPDRPMFPEHVLIQGIYLAHISSPALKRRFGGR